MQAGGGIYIPRQADEELLNLCRDATFAYVLTPRQMGKSSLMVRTAQTLAEEGIRAVIVDLQELGAQVTAEQWYFGFLVKLDDQLMFNTDVVSWWQEHEYLGVSQRLTLFCQQVLLAEVKERVVIFVDEIDTTLSLEFTDDFYAAIRYLYVARATNPEFQSLSWVLIGVATPSDLIRDPRRTPFNIGQRVDLTDFTFEEALPLADGLSLPTEEAKQVLRWVLKWTGGHPYLTQRLCGVLLKHMKSEGLEAAGQSYVFNEVLIDQIVSSTFFGVMSMQDNNLQFVRDMLVKWAPEKIYLLSTYRKIRQGKPPISDEDQSFIISHLKLSGIVRPKHGFLCVRNRIYQEVFNNKWIRENLPAKSWTIEQKIGYGYVVAIGIALNGSIIGLVIANYYRGREVRQFNQAHEQSQLLTNYKNAVIGAQLYSFNLVAVLEDPQILQTKKADFLKSVEKAKRFESQINGFIDAQPQALAATITTFEALLEDYATNLDSYVNQIEPVLREIDAKNVQPQKIDSVRKRLLKIMHGDTAMRLEQLSQTLTNILENAEVKEVERTISVEHTKGVERLIVTVSMLVSFAIASIIAWRTSRAISHYINTNSKDIRIK